MLHKGSRCGRESFSVPLMELPIRCWRENWRPVCPPCCCGGAASGQKAFPGLCKIGSGRAVPEKSRPSISYFDAATNKRLKFLTNNFALPALTIAEIYRSRWQVELFFESSTWCTPSDAMEFQGSVVPNCPLAGTSADSVRPGIVQHPLHAGSTVRPGRAAWPAAVSAGSVAEQW